MTPAFSRPAHALCVLTVAALQLLHGQQPLLQLSPNDFSRQPGTVYLSWSLYGRAGDAVILFADIAPGSTRVFGVDFDLGATPLLTPLWTGTISTIGYAAYALR